MNVHDHITDWQHLPSSFLAGKRARATTVEGTTIDGFLQSMTTKFSNGGGSMVQLFFGGVFQPVISQYDKDMCCLYIAEGMNYIWQQRENQELSRILESLADRKLMKRVHGGYAITLKGLLAVKAWRLHLFLFHHHDEYKYFRRKK